MNSSTKKPTLYVYFVDLDFLCPLFNFSVQTGALTSQLSDNPQKVNGLAGITLGAIIQSVATLIAGSVLGLVFIWKVALIGIGKALLIF